MVLEQTLSLYFLRPLCTLFYKQPQKINKQAEIGLKNYTIYRTTIQIQTKVTSYFFQPYFNGLTYSIQVLPRKRNLVSENAARLCFLALEINTENNFTEVSIRYPMGQKGNLPSTKCYFFQSRFTITRNTLSLVHIYICQVVEDCQVSTYNCWIIKCDLLKAIQTDMK